MILRPVRPEDTEGVQAFVRSLSPNARYDRFLGSVAELMPWQLERITASRGLSLAAVDRAGEIVGLAEYVPSAEGEAEFGVVVADRLQGQGLGRRLLIGLIDHARRAGFARLAGVTRAANWSMRLLAYKLGFRPRRDPDPELVRLELALS